MQYDVFFTPANKEHGQGFMIYEGQSLLTAQHIFKTASEWCRDEKVKLEVCLQIGGNIIEHYFP